MTSPTPAGSPRRAGRPRRPRPTGLPEVVDGYFALPEGLGVRLDVDACAEFPRQQAKFDLFAEDWHFRDPERSARATTR